MPSGVKVYLVRDAGGDPFSGAFHVFRAKRADRIKIVRWVSHASRPWFKRPWCKSGACPFAKRLDVRPAKFQAIVK